MKFLMLLYTIDYVLTIAEPLESLYICQILLAGVIFVCNSS